MTALHYWYSVGESNPSITRCLERALTVTSSHHGVLFGEAGGTRTRGSLLDREVHWSLCYCSSCCGKGCGYRAHLPRVRAECLHLLAYPQLMFLVPGAGIEPATYALSRRCSTAELTRHVVVPRTGIEPAYTG